MIFLHVANVNIDISVWTLGLMYLQIFIQNRKNVIMIPKMQYRNKILFAAFIAVLVTSCATIKNSNFDKITILNEAYTYVNSDADKFFIKFYGDYKFSDRIKSKEIKKVGNIIFNELGVKFDLKKSFVLKGKTDISPFYECSIFIDSVYSNNFDSISKEGVAEIDSIPYFYYYFTDSQKCFLYISWYSGKDLKPNIETMKQENREIINSLSFNTFFNNDQ